MATKKAKKAEMTDAEWREKFEERVKSASKDVWALWIADAKRAEKNAKHAEKRAEKARSNEGRKVR